MHAFVPSPDAAATGTAQRALPTCALRSVSGGVPGCTPKHCVWLYKLDKEILDDKLHISALRGISADICWFVYELSMEWQSRSRIHAVEFQGSTATSCLPELVVLAGGRELQRRMCQTGREPPGFWREAA